MLLRYNLSEFMGILDVQLKKKKVQSDGNVLKNDEEFYSMSKQLSGFSLFK